MNCPECDLPMFSIIPRMECLTGPAQKFKCRECGAEFWQQLTVGTLNFRPLRETNARLAQAFVGPAQATFY